MDTHQFFKLYEKPYFSRYKDGDFIKLKSNEIGVVSGKNIVYNNGRIGERCPIDGLDVIEVRRPDSSEEANFNNYANMRVVYMK